MTELEPLDRLTLLALPPRTFVWAVSWAGNRLAYHAECAISLSAFAAVKNIVLPTRAPLHYEGCTYCFACGKDTTLETLNPF